MSNHWKPTLGVKIRRGAAYDRMEIIPLKKTFELDKMSASMKGNTRRGLVDSWKRVTGK